MKKNLLVCLTLAAGTTAMMTGCESDRYASEDRSYASAEPRKMHSDEWRCHNAGDVSESSADSAAVNVGSSDLGGGSWSNRFAGEDIYVPARSAAVSTGRGYYDSNGVWHGSDSGSYATGGGYYDSNGVWRSSTSDIGRSASGGYYDGNGVWHGSTPDMNRNGNGYYDSNGVWRSNTSDMNRNGNGYYDSNGVWRSNTSDMNRNGTSTTGPVGGSAGTPGSTGTRAGDGSQGSYDNNGVWRSNTSDMNRNAASGYYDTNGVWRSNSSDSTGVWHGTTSPGGTVAIGSSSAPDSASIRRTDEPASGSRMSTMGGSSQPNGYYDNNGVWRSTTPSDQGNLAPTAHAQGNFDRTDKTDTATGGGMVSTGTAVRPVRMDQTNMQGEARSDTFRSDSRAAMASDRSAVAASWPDKNREQAQMLIAKYGQPDESTPSMMIWKDKGGFQCIKVFKEGVEHAGHTDFVEHAVSYKVPADKLEELAKFDTSILTDLTKGCMAARCDSEANNILALNLADDIVAGRKTAQEARDYLQKSAGKGESYGQRLNFTPAAADKR